MPSKIILSPYASPPPVALAAVHSNLAVVLLLIHCLLLLPMFCGDFVFGAVLSVVQLT